MTPPTQLIADARALEAAGAGMIVLEMVPAALAERVTDALAIPTIGIGAGADCSGQVLVLYDMLDVYPRRAEDSSKNFMAGRRRHRSGACAPTSPRSRTGSFPRADHAF